MSKPVGVAAEALAIQLRGVGLRFGAKSVLNDLDLDLDLDVGVGQKIAGPMQPEST